MKGKTVIGVVAVVCIGVFSGSVVGFVFGTGRGASSVIDDVVYKDARDVQSQIVVLKHLRAGEIDQGIEVIESSLDDQLVMFDPVEPYSGITEDTYAEVAKALSQCKEYRAEYPRESRRPIIDEMVERIIEEGVLD